MNTLVTIVVCAALLLVAVINGSYPVCETGAASILLGYPSICLTGIAGLASFLLAVIRKGRADVVRLIFVWLVGTAVAMSVSGRVHRKERAMWEFEGIVAERYQASTNHSAFSIRVEPGGSYEFIAREFWEKVKVGDHVAKQKCSEHATINGATFRIVP